VAHWVLLKLLPPEVQVEGLRLFLNPSDPVLSSAVALGIYENYEREVFASFCKPGAVVVDIGANVGLYTLTAAARVGPRGTVIAIEPHPESFLLLQKSVQTAGLDQVKCFNVAAGDSRQTRTLFMTDENKADSRVYDSGPGRREIPVQMIDVDTLLAENGIGKVDLIKMDIQGAEALALKGMVRTLDGDSPMVIFAEFWPWGIEQTGASAAELLRQLARAGFRLQEIDEVKRRLVDVDDVEALAARHASLEYAGADFRRSHANLLCVRG